MRQWDKTKVGNKVMGLNSKRQKKSFPFQSLKIKNKKNSIVIIEIFFSQKIKRKREVKKQRKREKGKSLGELGKLRIPKIFHSYSKG